MFVVFLAAVLLMFRFSWKKLERTIWLILEYPAKELGGLDRGLFVHSYSYSIASFCVQKANLDSIWTKISFAKISNALTS